MSQGWIKLHRSMIDWEWYTDHNTSRLFIHCLIRANHSDAKWRGNVINRGQFITSLETLSCETGLTISQVRTALKKLYDTNEIASLSQARSRVITVVKYDQYQSDDKLIASSSQADRKLIATDKNEKNEKNEKECNKTHKESSPDGSVDRYFGFEEFWKIYPKKKAREDAQKAWVKNDCHKIAETLINDVVNRSANDSQWQDKQFVPNGATYLNGKRWTDEIIKADNRPQFEKNNDALREELFGKKGETYEH